MAISTGDGSLLASILANGRAAQRRWQDTPVRVRLKSVKALRRLLVDETDALCEAVRLDIGKPPAETLSSELLPLAEACRFLVQEAERILKPRQRNRHRPLWLWGERDVVHRRPRGLVGVIGTWNYPLFLNGVQVLQALVAGNAVVWKPSEVAPKSAEALGELFRRAGFPDNLFQSLPATREAGKQLAQSDINHLVFTGHSDTGRTLAATLAPRLITSSLELSGCDAMLVLEDANVELAAKAAWFGATLNRGQTCLAVRRAFVARSAYARFLESLTPLARAAEPVDLALEAQSDLARGLVEEAILAGARPLEGCSDRPAQVAQLTQGKRFQPVVLADVRPEMTICRAATFAPVLLVLPFDRLEDALSAQEHCPYALGFSIFSENPGRAERIARALPVGMVTINDVVAAAGHPATPIIARGGSGWGATQGVEGLLEMTAPQLVSTRSGAWRPHYDPPGTTRWTSRRTLEALLQLGHAGRWRTRLKALWRLVRGA